MDGLDVELAQVAAILLEDRVIRRVIKKHRRLPGIGLQVPHARCYTLLRSELETMVERDEIPVPPAALPARVVIFGGSRTALSSGDPEELSRAWRVIFHGHVHLAFDRLLAEHAITAASVRERIHRIGQTEFDEIRSVLRQEHLLLPPADDPSTYAEFVALYLELRYFAPTALERTFPILELARVDAAIALDLDGAALLAAARPAHAPEQPIIEAPAPLVREPGTRVTIVDPSAHTRASRARARGNHARAAILALRAGDEAAAGADLEQLGARLARAVRTTAPTASVPRRGADSPTVQEPPPRGEPATTLDPGPAHVDPLRAIAPQGAEPPPPHARDVSRDAAAWAAALLPVAALAAGQRVLRFTPSARLLHDLQSACVVAEREGKEVSLATWALSLGKRPLVRALPVTRVVRVAKHLHAAGRKLPGCAPLPATDHERLAATVHELIARGDASVRGALRPKLSAALVQVGLVPANLPERVAENKLIDELLDQAVAVGHLSIGNLRDAMSRNDLKMPDLDRGRLARGDELLRADHLLSRSLDGVYRRGESYLRILQAMSSVLFGTRVGRFLSLYIILPVLGSFTAFKGAQEILDLVAKHIGRAALDLAALDGLSPGVAAGFRGLSAFAARAHHTAHELAKPPVVVTGAVVLFLVLHVPRFRHAVGFGLRQLGRGLRLALIDAPRALFRLSLVRRLLASRFSRWVVRPAIPAALGLAVTDGVLRWPLAIALFVVIALGLNSRRGRNAQEIVGDALVRTGRQLTGRIVPGIIRWTLEIFAKLMELLDRGLYRVDEWLRFKTGESRVMLIVKGVLGTVWSFVAYFLRLYVTLFVEPAANPVKHFPVVTVAAKLMLPFYELLLHAIRGPAEQVLGRALGTSFAAFTVFVLPGIAGFLVWELKENWRLYRKTRPKTLRPITIGHHGETMAGFLKPGFHAGTIPKRFTKLRRAAWRADERAVARHRDELHHIEAAIHRLADRELVALLNAAHVFRVADVATGRIALGSNRVQIDIASRSVAPTPARIVIELQSGWIIASVPERGWIDQLDDAQRRIFGVALAGFYKRAAVDLVREQLELALAGDDAPPPYDVLDEGLIVWPAAGYQTEAVYDLRAPDPAPRMRGAPWAGSPPHLGGCHALFFREPLTWAAWTTVWEQLARGDEPLPIVAGPSLIRRTPPPVARGLG